MSRKLTQDSKPDESSALAMQFGAVVRELRTRAGFSQEAFAYECGVHRTYMGLIERGRAVVSIYTAKRIADALGIPLSKLMSKIEAA